MGVPPARASAWPDAGGREMVEQTGDRVDLPEPSMPSKVMNAPGIYLSSVATSFAALSAGLEENMITWVLVPRTGAAGSPPAAAPVEPREGSSRTKGRRRLPRWPPRAPRAGRSRRLAHAVAEVPVQVLRALRSGRPAARRAPLDAHVLRALKP